jgi:hypothetical protein
MMSTELPIESKALSVLDNYEGANNYLLTLKAKLDKNSKFYPTRSQAEYILLNHDKVPMVAKKWVVLDTYFANKIADERFLMNIPEKMWIEKLLAEKDKAYHIWGKFFENDELSDLWIPKAAIIKDNKVEIAEVDYSKYSHRPPLDHQKTAIEELLKNKKYILADDMGLGKCEPKNNRIFTPFGRKNIGDIKVGDKVIGSDGKPHNVIGVFPQGVKETYRITFNDGFSILTGDEHLWSVLSPNYGKNTKNGRRKKSLVLSTKQMYEGGKIKVKGIDYNKDKEYEIETYYKSPNSNNKWQIPIVEPIQFERNDNLPINPYFLGLILGDGHINKSSCVFTVHCDDYDELFDSFGLTENKKIKNQRKGNKLIGRGVLNGLKLNETRSHNKFIPEIYKYSSVENRLSILQGLMDTDGHCMFNGGGKFLGTEFSTISKQLCDDVVEIVQTLGGIARVKTRIPTYTYNGEKNKGKLSYRVNIKLPKGMNPFKLKRKANKYIEPKKYPTGRYIKNIEKVGFEDSVCISVDSPDKLYVTEHCIVTHNTTSTIIASLETGAKKILIICPATLKINWQREYQLYSNKSSYVCEGKNYSEDAEVVIINYDIIKNFHDSKDPKNSSMFKSKFDLVIIDEAHYIQNVQAQRTKLINDLVKNIERLWLLTGTPMTSRPINYFNLLSLVDSPVAKNWMAYVIRYCAGYQFRVGPRKVWNVMGASNLEELRDRTGATILRRLKEDVLDLPEKIITPVYLRLRSKNYEELMGEYYNWYEKNPEESKNLSIQFSKLVQVRQLIADEKTQHTIELAENIIEQGKKVIIFCNFTNSLETIYNHFGKAAVRLDGSTSKALRQEAVDKFQADEKVKVFVGNIKSAGTGITLTAAEAVIMNDLSFLPSDHSQAEDRAYRYGQKNNVLVYYPLFENTLEGVIYDIVNNKKRIIATVMGDGAQDETNIVEEILNSINRKK